MTAVYTRWEQRKLSGQLETLRATYAPSKVHLVAAVGKAPSPAAVKARKVAVQGLAERLRESTASGQALGRIHVDRLGVDMILVDGTNHDALVRGPGVDRRTHLPGEGQLVYVAGHRTTTAPRSRNRPAPQGRSDRDGDALRIVRLSRHVPRDRAGRRSSSPSLAGTRRTRPAGVPSTILCARALHRLRGSTARERAHLGVREPGDTAPKREGRPAGARKAQSCPGTNRSARSALVDPELAARLRALDGSACHRPAVEGAG